MEVTFPATPSNGDTSVQNGVTYSFNTSSNAWTAEKNFLPATGGQLSGNLTFSGSQTVDGRDVSADGTKLDTIETNATADQTGAQIKSAYEAEAETNAFTDALLTKLNGIEASATADQTGAQIKSAYEGESDTNAFTDALLTKLNGVAASATAVTNNNQITNGAGYITSFTNTTYSAGTGMTLSGTTFNCNIDSPSEVGLGNLSSSGNNLAGNFTATGNITAYSDERLKENIQTIPDALEKVTSMRGVMFDKKSSEDEFSHMAKGSGVIAQELEKIAPELVLQGETYKSVAYPNLVGYLIEAVKELSAKVKKLEDK